MLGFDPPQAGSLLPDRMPPGLLSHGLSCRGPSRIRAARALNRERLELLAYGAALMVDPTDPEVEEVLTRSPLGGFPINDMRKQNASGSKFNHPPAPQPRHTGVARQALWWRARHPHIPLRCAKRDVPRAFKWHYLRPRDVPEFAVKLLGIVVISLVMPFGWLGAPGEFVAWSSAAKAHHGSFSPPQPEFNDVVSYDSKWLMDDGVVLEPLVGNRVYHSLACLDRTMVAVWGKEGVNVEKMAEEGEPAGTQYFDQQVISLPEPKRMKAKYLLAEPALQRGNRDVPLRLLQEVAGCAQYWSTVCPEMVPRLPALYRPVRGLETKTTSSAAAEVQAGADMSDDDWEDFWRTLDFIRLQLERPLGTSFRASFEKLLPFRERLAMPGASFRVLGGDATLERFGGIDWKAKRFSVEDFSQYAERLKAEIPHGNNHEIISIAEMMAFVALACSEAPPMAWGIGALCDRQR